MSRQDGPLDLDQHVGKLCVSFDFGSISPTIVGAVAPETNVDELLAAIQDDLLAVLDKHLPAYSVALDRDLLKITDFRKPEIIRPREERDAELEESRAFLTDFFQVGEAARQEKLANDPNNGKLGYWEVVGVRHDCIVHASSALEAIEKASDRVGDWESPDAHFIGEQMPEVF